MFFYFGSLFALVAGNQQENSVLLNIFRYERNKIVGGEVTSDDSKWKQVSWFNIIFYIVSYVAEWQSLLTESKRKVNVFSRYNFVLKIRVPLLCYIRHEIMSVYTSVLSILGKRIFATQLRSPVPIRDWILFCQPSNYHYLLFKKNRA